MAVGGGGNSRWLFLSNVTHSSKFLFKMSQPSGSRFDLQSVVFAGRGLLNLGKKLTDPSLFDSKNVCGWSQSVHIAPGP